jgi:flagellar biosynthetic protein FliR
MGAFSMFAPDHWPAFVLISTRLSGLMVVAPFWSMTTLPRSVRGAIVVVLAALIVPMSPPVAFPDRVLDIPWPLLTEFAIGTAIGLTAAVIVNALMMASEVVALQTGLSLGQVLTASVESGGPALSQLYGLLGIATFVTFGGPVALITGVARSLETIPPGGAISFDGTALVALRMSGAVFSHAMQIAAPVVAALTVTNIAMAILSRAVPQLNAMAMSFAVTIAVGLLMFGLSLPVMVRVVTRWTDEIPAEIGIVVGAMAPPGAR